MTTEVEQKILDAIGELSVGLRHLEGRFDQLELRFDRLEDRVGKLEEKVGKLEEKVGKLEEKVDSLEVKVYKFDQELSRSSDRLESYQKGSDKLVNLASSLIGGACIAIIAGVILSVLKG